MSRYGDRPRRRSRGVVDSTRRKWERPRCFTGRHLAEFLLQSRSGSREGHRTCGIFSTGFMSAQLCDSPSYESGRACLSAMYCGATPSRAKFVGSQTCALGGLESHTISKIVCQSNARWRHTFQPACGPLRPRPVPAYPASAQRGLGHPQKGLRRGVGPRVRMSAAEALVSMRGCSTGGHTQHVTWLTLRAMETNSDKPFFLASPANILELAYVK